MISLHVESLKIIHFAKNWSRNAKKSWLGKAIVKHNVVVLNMLDTMSEDVFFSMFHCFTCRRGPDKLRWWSSLFKIPMNWIYPYWSITESYNETSIVVYLFIFLFCNTVFKLLSVIAIASCWPKKNINTGIKFGTDSSKMFNVFKHVSCLNFFLNTFYADTKNDKKQNKTKYLKGISD